METVINHNTAEAWLKNHYKDVPLVWGHFDLEDAANSLEAAMTDLATEMCGDEPATFGRDAGGATYCEICGNGLKTMRHWLSGDYNDLPFVDIMCIMADSKIMSSLWGKYPHPKKWCNS